jgi:hypothetical protein
MTCKRIIALLVLAGISFLGLAGCESQPYKPWQEENAGQAESTPSMEPAASSMMASEPEPSYASQADVSSRTSGDVLLIESIQSAPAIQTPRKGVNMSSVRQQYGDPVSEGVTIGEPPITRWEYDGFSVYFEHDLVLHSVIHRPNQN